MPSHETGIIEWIRTLDAAGLALLALWLGARGTWIFGSVHNATIKIYEAQIARAEAQLTKRERECEEYAQLVRAWADTAHTATAVARKALEQPK